MGNELGPVCRLSGMWSSFNLPPIESPFLVCRRALRSLQVKCKSSPVRPLFGLSVLGYCWCMEVKHDGLQGKGSAHDYKYTSFCGTKSIVVFSRSCTTIQSNNIQLVTLPGQLTLIGSCGFTLSIQLEPIFDLRSGRLSNIKNIE